MCSQTHMKVLISLKLCMANGMTKFYILIPVSMILTFLQGHKWHEVPQASAVVVLSVSLSVCLVCQSLCLSVCLSLCLSLSLSLFVSLHSFLPSLLLRLSVFIPVALLTSKLKVSTGVGVTACYVWIHSLKGTILG